MVSENSIFEFWSKIGPSERIHPADKQIFDRIGKDAHSFKLRCLPSPIMGRLKDAPVVLLFLSPGFRRANELEAEDPKWQQIYVERRAGLSSLPSADTDSDWAPRIIKQFGIEWSEALNKVAVLNIGAYNSKNFSDDALLAALPSSRMSLSWAQEVLFPQAERGDRVVVCLRSAHFWGLEKGRKKPFGKSLYAPEVARSGFMCRKTPSQMRSREEIAAAVREAVKR